jgi:DNA-binding beta-propeller fold protein YncE
MAGRLSKITPDGVRSIIYTYEDRLVYGLAIDSSGNYVVVEHAADKSVLSRVSPTGDYDVIYAFPADTTPHEVAVDPQGNYIVTEPVPGILSMISASGAETVIFRFAEGTSPMGIAIEPTRPTPPGPAAGGIVVLMMAMISVGLVVAILPALIMRRGRGD